MIFLQPDLSAAVTILMLGVMLFFLAGGDWKVILLVFVLALLVGVPLMYLYPTGRERLSSYLTGLNNPLQSSYHIQRTLEAVVKGGWFGGWDRTGRHQVHRAAPGPHRQHLRRCGGRNRHPGRAVPGRNVRLLIWRGW